MAASLGKISCRNFSRFYSIVSKQSSTGSPLLQERIGRCASTQTSNKECDVSSEEIVIPNRIARSPTAVLEALAAEVSRDPLAPDYIFMDDPYLIPGNNFKKRDYSLARGSGRKAALWVIENFPDAFANEFIAEPRVDNFMPTPSVETLLKEHGNTSTALQNMIVNKQVQSAWNLYTQLIEEGTTIPKDIQQQLLELMSYYNGKDDIQNHIMEELDYQRDLKLQLLVNKRTQRKTWTDDGPAMNLFQRMEKTSQTYNTIIQGMCKYGATEDARELYKNMVDQNMQVSEVTFSSLISVVPSIQDDNETRWGIVSVYLKDMQTMNVAPTLDTFNTVLTTLLGFGKWRRMKPTTLEVLGEMKECGIEPSLSTWSRVVRLFYYTDSQNSPILHEIIEKVANHGPYTPNDVNDFDFFSVAMNKTNMNLKDVDLAKRIDAVLNMNDNSRFLGDAAKESQYYNNYLKLLCSLVSLDETMEVYERCTPHIFTPHVGSLAELLNAIELYDGHRYLPRIWSDVALFEYTRRDDLMEPIFAMMACGKHDDSVQVNCRHAVAQIRAMITDAEEMERMNSPVLQTGSIIGNWIQICLNSNDLELATYYYDLYVRKSHSLSGVPSEAALAGLAAAFVEAGDIDRFIDLAYRMSELGYGLSELVENGKEKLELTDSQIQRLTMMK